jgi:hypothetical protein
MRLDLRLHWFLVSIGISKKCPHKIYWQQIRANATDKLFGICCGCLTGWSFDKKFLADIKGTPKEQRKFVVDLVNQLEKQGYDLKLEKL